jgi:glycosyltransferase involved in cell wall biosynthesis
MRILLLTSTFHPLIGGAESYAYMIANGLSRKGHEILILTDNGGNLEDQEMISDDISVTRLGHHREKLQDPSNVFWEQMYFGLLPQIESVIHCRPPDLIFANSLECTLVGAMIALTYGLPLVSTFHEHEPHREALGRGRCGLLYRHTPVDMFIAGSKAFALRATTYGAENRTKLIYHGIDTSIFNGKVDASQREDFRRARGFTPDDIVVISAGRLKRRKGQHELLLAFVKALAVRPRLRLLFAGTTNSASPEYASALEKSIEFQNLGDRVLIDRTLGLTDMPLAYGACEIVAQPSHGEGLGLAVLEGMASRRAVVTTPVMGIEEIVTAEKDSIVVELGDIEALSAALVRLTDDPSLRGRLGRAGRATVLHRFSHSRMINETEQLFREIVSIRDLA